MKKNKEITIGLITNNYITHYSRQITNGIINKCRELDINIYIFTGEPIDMYYLNMHRSNAIYKLIDKTNVDGLIINSGSISNFVNDEKFYKFINLYKNIPKVSISKKLKNITSIITDNKEGFTNLLEHLIKFHKKQKIVYVSGPKTNTDAIERLDVYHSTLKKFNIKLNPELIIYGDFTVSNYTRDKLCKLLKRKKENKLDFDTIVCANDDMAFVSYDVIKEFNYKIPDDIMITGFDNNRLSKFMDPPLTTVAQPLNEIGEKSAELIYKIINGDKVKKVYKFSSNVIIRDSCRCLYDNNIMDQNSINLKIDNITQLKNNFDKIIDKVLSKVIDIKYFNIENKPKFIKEIRKFIIVLLNEIISSKNKYRKEIRLLLQEHLDDIYIIDIISKIIESCYDVIKDIINNKDPLKNIVASCSNIYLSFLKEVESFYNKSIESDYSYALLGKLSEFDSAFELDKFIIKLESIIEKLKFDVFYLAAYTKNKKAKFNQFDLFTADQLPTEYSKEIYSYFKGEEIHQNYNYVYKTNKIFPDYFKNKLYEKKFALIVAPIFFENLNFGYFCYNLINYSVLSYNLFFLFIKSTLKSISLFNEIESTKKQLESSNKKLKQLDNLKNDFIANITHDFRSPLTVILNMADLGLKTISDTDSNNKENYDLIYNAGLKLKRSIDKLLELAKLETLGLDLKIENVKLIKFINTITNFYISSVAGTKIKIIKKISDKEILNFYTDREKLEEVLNNILSNSVKFINSENGKIIIEVKQSKNDILIKITDNGIGIEKSKLKSIFNRFEQAGTGRNSIYQGTGIGLAYSKQLINLLKGKIWAESKGVGKGAVIFVKLLKGKTVFPEKDYIINFENKVNQYTKNNLKRIIKNEINNKNKPENITVDYKILNEENEYDIKKAKILIVDDDVNITNIIKRYLENNGFQNFITAHDGKKGLEAVFDHSPDVIVCDYNMPNMKGNEFHDELLNNPGFSNIPFIFLSAIDNSKIISKQRKKGAKAYLLKPINEEELIITVNQNLEIYYDYLKIYKIAMYDELTNIYNRREIKKILKHEILKRKFNDISVIFFDIDLFKSYNDAYGHKLGDEILRIIGKLLNNSLRSYDCAGRMGGDEFIIILPDTNIFQAEHVAEIIRTNIINLDFKVKNKKINVTCSFGVASLQDNEEYICKKINISDYKSLYQIENPNSIDWDIIEAKKTDMLEILLELSDIALYRAKSSVCKSCNHSFIKNTDKCPKCDSLEIIKGRNKIVVFKE